MSDKPKRRWYQVSLRMLLASMSAISLLLGVCGRIAYLQQQAQFHDGEYFRYIDAALDLYGRDSKPQSDGETLDDRVGTPKANQIREFVARSQWHKGVAENYRRAVYRPWQVVDETQFTLLPESAP